MILHRAGSVKCASHMVNRAPWGGQALGAPSVTQGRAQRGRTSHQPKGRGDPGGITGGRAQYFLNQPGEINCYLCFK